MNKRKTFKISAFANNMRQIMRLLNQYKSNLVITTILSLATTLIGLICPKIIAYATNELYYGKDWNGNVVNSIDFDSLIMLLSIALCLYILLAGLNIIKSFLSNYLSTSMSYKIRKDIINKIHKLDAANFEKLQNGDILSRILNDVKDITNSVSNTFVNLIVSVSLIIGSFIMMLSINIILTLIVLIYCPLSILLLTILVKITQHYFINQKQLLGSVNSYMEESITGSDIIKSYNKQKSFISTFKKMNKNLYTQNLKSAILGSILAPITTIINYLIYIIILIVGAYMSIVGQFTLGDILAFVQYADSFKGPLNTIVGMSNAVQLMAASCERIYEILNMSDEELENIELNDLKCGCENPVIEFENVSFSYNNKNTILKNFNLKINEGETIAIVGPTGAGKSTIVKLLMKFYKPNSGKIYLYGQDISTIKSNEVRNQMSMVLQDVWLYNSSIANNIKYGKQNANIDEIEKYANIVNVDKFVNDLPGKWDYTINERATNLSQGQKQLVSIARALLPQKPILILDEATSSVDSATEKDIYEAFDKIINTSTSIVIAHRLSTIVNADHIIVLNNGEILESGNHAQLIKKNGFYYDLFKSSID